MSTDTLMQAKEAVEALLTRLDLAAYLYEVEPTADGNWEIRIECAGDGGWQSCTLEVDKYSLAASHEHPAVAAELEARWREALAGCKRR